MPEDSRCYELFGLIIREVFKVFGLLNNLHNNKAFCTHSHTLGFSFVLSMSLTRKIYNTLTPKSRTVTLICLARDRSQNPLSQTVMLNALPRGSSIKICVVINATRHIGIGNTDTSHT